MLFSTYRYKERKEGLKEIQSILESRSEIFAIHYSCESFNKAKSGFPRITSISLYNIQTREQTTYSLHLEAQKKKYNVLKLSNGELDASERSLLSKFYKFAKQNRGCLWVHWNMKNARYGFDALRNRYDLLEGRNVPTINIKYRFDLKVLLKKLYGPNFEANEYESKLLGLVNRNSFSLGNICTGGEEADAFIKKNFQALMASSQDKAEAIGIILRAAGDKRLKVNSTLIDIYGISAQSAALFVGDNFSKILKIGSSAGGLLKILAAL